MYVKRSVTRNWRKISSICQIDPENAPFFHSKEERQGEGGEKGRVFSQRKKGGNRKNRGRDAILNNFEQGEGRGEAGRVRFLTDVKNVTRMQSKLCHPVSPRFIISLPRPSRRKFNSRKPCLLSFLHSSSIPLSSPLSLSLSLSLVNIMVAKRGGHLRSPL